MFVRAYFLLLFPIYILASVHASDWQDSFYTDDSTYYLKLHTDGFVQRFRVAKEHCSPSLKAEIILKTKVSLSTKASKASNASFAFHAQDNKSVLSSWPRLFGIDDSKHCWYEASISGIDLNRPQDNDYIIKITTDNGTSFFKGYSDSLLVQRRIVSKLASVDSWINLGAMGATPVDGGGVFYKIWEPEADRVDLFVNESSKPIVMIPNIIKKFKNNRIHVNYLKNSKVGDSYYYKFFKENKYETLEVANDGLFSDIKIDPMARKIIYERKGGRINGYINPRGVVVGKPEDSSWESDNKVSNLDDPSWNNWLIYQLWPLTFNPSQDNRKFKGGTFKDIFAKIDYLADLGVNAVEFLPVGESRFKASWGYALDSILAIESTLGSSDDLKKLVESFHSKDIRVIFDVVINHINNDLLREPLSEFIYKSKYFNGNTIWGPKPDYSNIFVRRWIKDSLISLMRDYHIDGFRFDMTASIYADGPIRNYSADGYTILQELNVLLKQNNPQFYTSAEELPDNVWITRNIGNEGAGFDSQWNDRFKNFFEEELNNYRPSRLWVDLFPLQRSLLGYSNHLHYGNEMSFGPPIRTVNYIGSHDFIGNKNPILRTVSDYFSEESDAHNKFYRVRPLEDPFDTYSKFKMVHNDFTHGVARLCYGILFTKPGAILFYQGEEVAQDLNIENEWSYVAAKENNSVPTQDVDIDRYVGSHRMPWEFFRPTASGELSFLSDAERRLFSGHHKFFQDMIDFRKQYPSINYYNAYNVRVQSEQSTISYQIQDGTNEFFVIANFGGENIQHWHEFPQGVRGNWWKEIINSSSKIYGGASDGYNNLISNLGGRNNLVRMARSTIMVFKAENDPSISKNLFLMSNFNKWIANDAYKLKYNGQGVFSVEFYVRQNGNYQFKLASKDWDVELGDSGHGYLSYTPDAPNVNAYLETGFYSFQFNTATYKYDFVRVDQGN